ncbi:MAG: HEAT repeat domain-containing protein [Rhizobacter sp.]|nr:HEAT repeat domain-containing protein [Rhizobacter sp.]
MPAELLDQVEANNKAVLYRCRLSQQLTDDLAPALVALLQSSDRGVVFRSLAALHTIGPAAKQTIAGIRLLLDHPDPEVQKAAIFTLSHVGLDTPEQVMPLLLERVESAVHVEALLFAFIHIGHNASAGLPLVASAIRSSSGHTRRLALRCLEAIGTSEAAAAPLLLAAQNDRNAEVRAMASKIAKRYAGA